VLTSRRQEGARSQSPAMEEIAKPNYERSGWRKGTRTIKLIPLTNLVNEISLENGYHGGLSLSREK
jgi:hypothetical protein